MTRKRRDGWSPEVQCAFLAELYLTGSVTAAARAVERSRESAHRLRKKRGAESFCEAWDRILAGPAKGGPRKRRVVDWRKVTNSDLFWRVSIGFWQPKIYRGKMRAIARKPDNSGLLRLLRRLNTRCATIDEAAQ